MRFSNEFKVGLLTLFVLAFTVWMIDLTDDRPEGSGEPYRLIAYFPSAAGIFVSTQVEVAGVAIGSVRAIDLDRGRARVTLEISSGVKLPKDSFAQLSLSGMLGDKVVRITPGQSSELLADGDEIATRSTAPDVEVLTEKLERISGDIETIAAGLSEVIGNPETREGVGEIVQNVRHLTGNLDQLANDYRREVDALLAGVARVTEGMGDLLQRTGDAVEGELAGVHEATERLNATLASLQEIVDGVREGRGTLGALVVDDEPIRQVQAALDETRAVVEEVGQAVSDVTGMRTEVGYFGQGFAGTDPADGGFANPMAGGFMNTVQVRLVPRDEKYYLIELVDHPLGTFDLQTTTWPASGTSSSQVTQTNGLRYTAQIARRWGGTVLRFGLKESSGGVGVDRFLLGDRLMLSADLFDFTVGSWPVLDGTPNLRLGFRAEPVRHLWLGAGLDNVLLGARYGYVTGYAGAGFWFDDQDLKWLLAVLPSP